MKNRLKTIILSRLKIQTEEEQWVKDRRKICKTCEYNTLNGGRLKWYKHILAKLSYLYSWMMNRSRYDVLGICSACEACSLYFKTLEKDETCKKNKWEILKDNSIRLNIREQRKNDIRK